MEVARKWEGFDKWKQRVKSDLYEVRKLDYVRWIGNVFFADRQSKGSHSGTLKRHRENMLSRSVHSYLHVHINTK